MPSDRFECSLRKKLIMKRGKELHAQWLKAACSLPLDVMNSEEEIIKAIENQNTKLSADYLVTLKNKVFKKKKWPDNSPVQLKNKSSRKLLKKKKAKEKKTINKKQQTNQLTNKQINKQTKILFHQSSMLTVRKRFHFLVIFLDV